VSAFVSDTNGNPVTNVPVTFSTTRGTLVPSVANTDGNGVALSNLTASETATVTARVGSGADNRTATLEVRTTTTPSFTLATTPTNPTAGQPVTLTITPAANTAPTVRVNWGDGDEDDVGVVSAARSVTHIYDAPGFFTISATGSQAGDEFTNSVAVTVAQRPPVGLTVDPTSGSTATVFTFTITPTTGALIQNITIEYGDGQQDQLGAIATQTTRQHRYTRNDTFTAIVTQTETSGNVTRATVTVSVTP
jgi:adhesin/invasin